MFHSCASPLGSLASAAKIATVEDAMTCVGIHGIRLIEAFGKLEQAPRRVPVPRSGHLSARLQGLTNELSSLREQATNRALIGVMMQAATHLPHARQYLSQLGSTHTNPSSRTGSTELMRCHYCVICRTGSSLSVGYDQPVANCLAVVET
jgi:hypothetical protein